MTRYFYVFFILLSCWVNEKRHQFIINPPKERDFTSSDNDQVQTNINQPVHTKTVKITGYDEACKNTSTCGKGLLCFNKKCSCQWGWKVENKQCIPMYPNPEFNTRTKTTVCNVWKAKLSPSNLPHQSSSKVQEACSPGSTPPDSINSAVKTINQYRYLLGLNPVYHDNSLNLYAQSCATLLQNLGRLVHRPEKTVKCYSDEAYQGTSHANLGKGYSTTSAAINGYVEDSGTRSLGHRRWLFWPQLLTVGIAHKGKFNCSYVITPSANSSSKKYALYPAPGYFPISGLRGAWSISFSNRIGDISIKITDLETNTTEMPTVTLLSGTYGKQSAVSYQPKKLTPKAGQRIKIEISNLEKKPIVYKVNFVLCN